MVNFTVDEIRQMMDHPTNIRNISVIAHVDHGKSTLSDSLIGAAGIIATHAEGSALFMQTRKDEQERTITIKASSVSLFYEVGKTELTDNVVKASVKVELIKSSEKKKEGDEAKDKEDKLPFLINLIDSPGHVDFSSEVTAALRVTDGALVVVDCVEGVCVQTETVLRQAIAERIRPILFVNKLDRCFLELHLDYESAYQNFVRAIESVNVVIATYKDDLLGEIQVYPEGGTVGFGSGLHAWGFTVGRFAKMYAAKFGVSVETLGKRLWGDNYFSGEDKKWIKKPADAKGNKLDRAFCAFILKPIDQLFTAVMNDKKDVYVPMLTKLGVTIPKDAEDLKGKALLKRIMQTWLPASETLLSMIVNFLPSPVVAQKYRVENLYSGPQDDTAAKAIRACDPKGPLMMYVSKMMPTSEKGRFYAFGRVFSGTVASGQAVRIQGPDYVPGKKNDLFLKKVQRTILLMGRYTEQLQDCPCGNVIGLVGIDAYLLKAGTITTQDDAHNFVSMKYSVAPVVRLAVECTNAADLPKLMEGLKRLAKSDPLVQCYTAPTGEHIVAGAGELHLEVCMKDLREDFMKGAPIKVGRPVVSFGEGVKSVSSMDIIAKSPNKHNRLFMKAEPLGDDFIKAVESGEISMELEAKVLARKMADEYKWEIGEARKLWSFGCPPDGKANCFVDNTKGVAYLNEVKDSIVGSFIQTTMEGVLAGECMRGIKFSITDIVLHADAVHRGAGQIMPPTKRGMYACQLKSEPVILEPVYSCDITVPQHAIAGVYSTLNQRRGIIEGKEDRPGTPLCKIKAFLPVLESFGFAQLLRQNTSGQAFPQMIFDHWQAVAGDPLEEGTQSYNIVMSVRERKGMKQELPDFNEYYDKL